MKRGKVTLEFITTFIGVMLVLALMVGSLVLCYAVAYQELGWYGVGAVTTMMVMLFSPFILASNVSLDGAWVIPVTVIWYLMAIIIPMFILLVGEERRQG